MADKIYSPEKYDQLYVNLDKLGEGQYAQVFKAKRKDSNQSSNSPDDPEFFAAKKIKYRREAELKTVVNEIEIMKRIKKTYDEKNLAFRMRNVVMLMDSFKESKHIYLVLELICGGELFLALENTPDFHFCEETSARYMLQIFSAAQFIHDLNIVHLDLKPENILCCSSVERLKLADFGISIDLSKYKPGEEVCAMVGTADYISPECLNYDPISTKTDMWSIGVIMFILVSGLSPFYDDDDNLTKSNVTKCEFDFDYEEFDFVSEAAKVLIRKLLVKDPGSRLSAEECKDDAFIIENLGTPDDKSKDLDVGTRTLSSNMLRNISKINMATKKWRLLKNAVKFANMASLASHVMPTTNEE